MTLTNNEKNLIFFLRDVGFGQVTIKIENRQPIRIIKSEQSILLVNLYSGKDAVDKDVDTQN